MNLVIIVDKSELIIVIKDIFILLAILYKTKRVVYYLHQFLLLQ
jgi:hypothetical protein